MTREVFINLIKLIKRKDHGPILFTKYAKLYFTYFLFFLELKSRRHRSSSLPSRGNVRSSVKEDSIHDLPSQLSAAVHAEDLSGSSLEVCLSVSLVIISLSVYYGDG